jgi:hypothetical protein
MTSRSMVDSARGTSSPVGKKTFSFTRTYGP